MSEAIRLIKGTSGVFPQTITTDGTTPSAAFLQTDVLAGRVWAGNDQPTLLTPAVSWTVAGPPQFQISFSPADTASLNVGIYRLQATATRGADTVAIFNGYLEVEDAPGSATARPTYITIVDLRRECAWIDEVQQEGEETGFLDACADARCWMDENILRNYRGGSVSLLGMHGLALDMWFSGGPRRTSLDNLYIRDQLAAGALMVTDRLKKVMACYALAKILRQHMTRNKDYLGFSVMFLNQAHSLLVSSVAQLDINQDGNPEIPINFSSCNTLFS